MAQATCVPKNDLHKLPECTDECLNTHTRKCDREGCLCGDDLKAWCESSEGPQIWFSQYGYCVAIKCADDGDIESLMAIYTLLCEGTAGGPLNNDTVPLPLRDYAVKNTLKATATPSVSRPGSQSFATSTGTVSAGTGTLGFGSLSSDTAATASGSAATILDDKASSASRAANTASSSNTTSEVDQPVLSTAAIAGIAVGGTVLLALLIGAAFFILRRHKRNKSAKMALPPVYEPVDEKLAYGKPELDGQVLQHQYSEMGTGAPMEYAELDAGAPISPGRQSAQLSEHDERARTRQDF